MKRIIVIIPFLFLSFVNSDLFSIDKTLEWSDYQGKHSWRDAAGKCESIGMRLPTIWEFRNAYNSRLSKSWEEKGDSYWTYSEAARSFDDAYCFNIIYGEHSLSYINVYKHVRCVRYSN
ncbi:MAG TPA: hypothetical protein PK079_10700 [Leptospiraceae bacterium]|nr:hypothetical protein [Leptospiraceae bacterium]HMW05898.1 hypothetical protein [Leptospiraceae bacterium]HMX32676.1 hypothetical protein [Leptospiraceae bacterium]HMY32737.1 hypothetical protein [Leptospiraceae bacterium]HMZ62544.1 hypothetical protein [Leptospiraceae bacterium]